MDCTTDLGLVDSRSCQLLQFVYFIHRQLGEELQKARDVSIVSISPELSRLQSIT